MAAYLAEERRRNPIQLSKNAQFRARKILRALLSGTKTDSPVLVVLYQQPTP